MTAKIFFLKVLLAISPHRQKRALTLYSGMLGTFLQQPDLSIHHYAMPVNGYSAITLMFVAYHSLASRLLEQDEQSPTNLAIPQSSLGTKIYKLPT